MVFAVIPVAIWAVLLFGRGGFWRVRQHLAPQLPSPPARSVVAVIPARDEEENIGQTVRSLAGIKVIVVDDNSSDRTAEIARQNGATVISGQPLPSGWTGKMWALHQGVAVAATDQPDYLLFTDADITHGRGSVDELVAIAENGGYDLTSFMVKLACKSVPEKLLIPAFVFFFFMLYPPKWIASPKHEIAGAAGGCVLIRPAALTRAGGIEAIRNEIIDDCALARAVKRSGGRIWLGLTETRHSERRYAAFSDVWHMIARTAFKQLDHSGLLLLGTLLGLTITYVLPIALLFTNYAIFGLVAWGMMTVAYASMVRFYRVSPLWSLTLPLAAVFYAAATAGSAIQYWRGAGGEWKGRAQDVQS